MMHGGDARHALSPPSIQAPKPVNLAEVATKNLPVPGSCSKASHSGGLPVPDASAVSAIYSLLDTVGVTATPVANPGLVTPTSPGAVATNALPMKEFKDGNSTRKYDLDPVKKYFL